jgi:acetoin utilization deacetylase AcuC-like enzyme
MGGGAAEGCASRLSPGPGGRRVGLYDHPAFREHDSGPGHPERPQRLDAVRRGMREAGLEPRLQILTPRPASREELQAVHTAGHIDRVASTEGRTYRFDPDTQAGPRSYAAALLAAGSVVDATDRVLAGELDRAFCAVRPPGHHAEADRAMGFCLFNNIAVGAARALAAGLRRVAVVDFDVHHGNGTQHIFEDDPRVLYVSTHAYRSTRGRAAWTRSARGRARASPSTFRCRRPWGTPSTVGSSRDREPRVRPSTPSMVLVSAGFDPHRETPGGHGRDRAGLRSIAASCLAGASGPRRRRAIFVLEGGMTWTGSRHRAAGHEGTAGRDRRGPARIPHRGSTR